MQDADDWDVEHDGEGREQLAQSQGEQFSSLAAREVLPELTMPVTTPPTLSQITQYLVQQQLATKGISSKSEHGVMMFGRKGNSTTGHGPQQVCFEFAGAHSLCYCVQWVHTRRAVDRMISSYRYGAFSSPKDIYTFIRDRNAASKYKTAMCEIIRASNPARLYFDIDCLLAGGQPHDVRIIDAALACIDSASSFAISNGVPPLIAEAIVLKHRCGLKPDGSYKVSFHMIFPWLLFKNNHDGLMKEWAVGLDDVLSAKFSDIFDREILTVVDRRVYTSNRILCLTGCVKQSASPEVWAASSPMKVHQLSVSASWTDAEHFQHALVSIPPGFDTAGCFFATRAPLRGQEEGQEDQESVASTQASAIVQVERYNVCLPSSEQRLVEVWAKQFYSLRKTMYDLPDEPFHTGDWKVGSTGKVFLQMPCDRYCSSKKRVHRDDEGGRQTSYEVDLLTSGVRQCCYSCGTAFMQFQKMSVVPNFDVYTILCGGTEMEVAYAIKEEFSDKDYVAVSSVSRERYNVWIWDHQASNNGTYNQALAGCQLWVAGGTDYLKVAVVAPWINRKFSLLQDGATGDRLKNIKKKKAALNKTGVLTTVTTYVRTLLADRATGLESFQSRLNKALCLIATNDGCVVNLCDLSRRQREASDMFSIEASFRLLDLSTAENKARVKKVDDFAMQIYSNVMAKKEYAHKVFGNALTGSHDDRHVINHLGVGSNGKTSLDELFGVALGPFHKNVRAGFLSKKSGNNSSSCSPDLMALQNARYISCNETEHGAKLDDARFKLMADGGIQSGRHLYEDETQVKLPGQLHIFSNYLLKYCLPGGDPAVIDRLVVLSYNVRFVVNPNPAYAHEIQRDPAVVHALKTDPDAVGTWLCLGAEKAIADIKQHGSIVIPDIVKDETRQELATLDTMARFIDLHCQICPEVVNRPGSECMNISRSDWSFETRELWGGFKTYVHASGSEDRFDEPSFNACCTRFFANTNVGVTKYNHGNQYYWLGIKQREAPARPARRIADAFANAPPMVPLMRWDNTD